MSYLNRLFSGWAMKRILLVGCFILLAAAIWFLGPFLGFGEARPLESYEARIICILLALLLILGFWYGAPRFVIAAVVACAAVWVIGPFILVGDDHPLTDGIRRGNHYRHHCIYYTYLWHLVLSQSIGEKSSVTG